MATLGVDASACVTAARVASFISDVVFNDDFLIGTRDFAGAGLSLCGRPVNHPASFSLFSFFSSVHFILCCRRRSVSLKTVVRNPSSGAARREIVCDAVVRSKCQVDDDKWPAVADKLVFVRRPDVREPYHSSLLEAHYSQECCLLLYVFV